jgi:hypothetical protein
VVELSLNGEEFVNRSDPGREVQVAFYDGNAKYDLCAACTGVFGWNLVQGGDKYGHGSPVLEQRMEGGTLYIKSQPIHWYPDDKGGSPSRAAPGDIIIEQTISAVDGNPRAFRLRYRITHTGTDEHANSLQEFPAIYLNRDYDRIAYYGGETPWTGGALTFSQLPALGSAMPESHLREEWAAVVNSSQRGVTMYAPGQYPFASGFRFAGSGGPSGTGTSYFRPLTTFSFPPGAVMEGEVYIIAGEVTAARAFIATLRTNVAVRDAATPMGFVDEPKSGAVVSRWFTVSGWVFDNAKLEKVEVFVDGVTAGVAELGLARADVPRVFPSAPLDAGYALTFDSSRFANGTHRLSVRATDAAGNVAVLPPVAITISN